MTPAFSSMAAFLAMGGYAFYVWLSVFVTIAVLVGLAGHAFWQHRILLQTVRRQQQRERRLHQARERMNKEHVDAGTP